MPTVAPTCCRRHRGQERYEYLSVNLGNIGSPPSPPTPIFSNAHGCGCKNRQVGSVPAVELPTVRKRGAARLRDSGLPWTIGRSDFAESSQLGNVGPAAGVRVHRAWLRLYLKRRSYAPLTLNSRACVVSGAMQLKSSVVVAVYIIFRRRSGGSQNPPQDLLDCMYQGFTRAPVFSSLKYARICVCGHGRWGTMTSCSKLDGANARYSASADVSADGVVVVW